MSVGALWMVGAGGQLFAFVASTSRVSKVSRPCFGRVAVLNGQQGTILSVIAYKTVNAFVVFTTLPRLLDPAFRH
jgi:hypothetical protein